MATLNAQGAGDRPPDAGEPVESAGIGESAHRNLTRQAGEAVETAGLQTGGLNQIGRERMAHQLDDRVLRLNGVDLHRAARVRPPLRQIETGQGEWMVTER